MIFAPFFVRLPTSLSAERAERIRSQERAEVAAHLHDSVLQTLALVQKRAGDPREVAALARRQERELRAWLSGGPAHDAGERWLAAELESAAQDVEQAHGVPIDVVAVGDAQLDRDGEALVAAAREAMLNAAKFAGGGAVAVYAEAAGDRLEVFVRDRGPGFDPPRCRRTAAACASRSSGAWSATAAAPRSTRRPAVAPRSSSCSSGARRERIPSASCSSTTTSCFAPACARSSTGSSTSSATPPRSPKRSRDRRARARRRAARRAHARRRRPGGHPPPAGRRDRRARSQFLALSVSDAAEDVIAVIRAGARGYVTKTISGADLADAVRRVHGGDAVFSPRLAGFVLDAFAGAAARDGAADRDAELDALTPREREVLQHIARGYMYKEIALRLGISAKTVEAHVSAVLRKLQLSSRHELSRWAAERRLDG